MDQGHWAPENSWGIYMTLLLSLGMISCGASLLLTPLFRNVALRLKLVDEPDNIRKLHRVPVPRIGGIPIALSYVLACSAIAIGWGRADAQVQALLSTAWELIPATVVVFLVGLGDDLFGLKPSQKLLGELLAAIFAVSAGVQIRYIAGITLPGWIGIPVTVIWLVGCANALNLVDGLDGLAAGIGLLATATTLFAALLEGDIPLAIATVPLAGALVGFLGYNFNPASIFLGDSGSLTLGFLLGCFTVLWAEKSATIVGMTAPLIALAVPLLDTILAILRRALRRQPIFGADRSHIHHRLLARGLTPRRVVLLLYVAAGLASAFSLLLGRARGQWDGVIILVFAVGALAGVEHLGYEEFKTARELVMNGAFWRALNAQLAIQNVESGLGEADSVDDCWAIILDSSRNFGFYRVRMHVGGRSFESHSGGESQQSWAIRIPLSRGDWVELGHQVGVEGTPMGVGAFAEAIHRIMRAKTAELPQDSGPLLEMAERIEAPREKVNGGNGMSQWKLRGTDHPGRSWFDGPET